MYLKMSSISVFFNFYFLSGGKLRATPTNVLVSVIQHKSVITEYQVELPVLFSNFPVAVLHVILHMIVVSATLHSSPPLPSLCPQVHSPHLHLQSFPAHRFSSTTFLESIDMR